MTMPPGDDGIHSLLGQILTKQGEIAVQVAVISKTLEQIPDHENRLRALEQGAAQATGGRDLWARLAAAAAVLAAAGSAVAQYVHH